MSALSTSPFIWVKLDHDRETLDSLICEIARQALSRVECTVKFEQGRSSDRNECRTRFLTNGNDRVDTEDKRFVFQRSISSLLERIVLTCRRWDFHSRGVDSCRTDVSLVIEFLLENLIYVAKLNISKRLKTFELFVDYVRVASCARIVSMVSLRWSTIDRGQRLLAWFIYLVHLEQPSLRSGF